MYYKHINNDSVTHPLFSALWHKQGLAIKKQLGYQCTGPMSEYKKKKKGNLITTAKHISLPFSAVASE